MPFIDTAAKIIEAEFFWHGIPGTIISVIVGIIIILGIKYSEKTRDSIEEPDQHTIPWEEKD